MVNYSQVIHLAYKTATHPSMSVYMVSKPESTLTIQHHAQSESPWKERSWRNPCVSPSTVVPSGSTYHCSFLFSGVVPRVPLVGSHSRYSLYLVNCSHACEELCSSNSINWATRPWPWHSQESCRSLEVCLRIRGILQEECHARTMRRWVLCIVSLARESHFQIVEMSSTLGWPFAVIVAALNLLAVSGKKTWKVRWEVYIFTESSQAHGRRIRQLRSS
jgi:hypothetical protein